MRRVSINPEKISYKEHNMKRRNALKILPLSITGAAYQIQKVLSQDPRYDYPVTPPAERLGDVPLAVRHLKKVRDMLLWIRETQSENLLEASYAMAQRVKNKRTCWVRWDMGHSHNADLVPGREGLPDMFAQDYKSENVNQGDLILINSGSVPEEDRGKLLVIGAPAPWGGDAHGSELNTNYETAKHRLRPYSDIWIETNITTLGAITRIPGEPAPIGPVSGIFGMVTFWMMAADACRILARDGISVNVLGSGPELDGKDTSINLNNPLMDDYFEQFLIQLDMFEAEMGAIRMIAEMAVDSALDGGRVFVYSRDHKGLAVEAQGRRGGLTMTKGVFDKDGELRSYLKGERTPKDLVIMGILEPDSPDDMKHLATFKKEGVKLASIGPMTRGWKIPEGPTVPKQVDAHIGSMCDTNGLFALPGFNRKVSPTSGPIQNQLFWAVCMEIAEQVIRRTGNAPGVLFSAAIRGSRAHNESVRSRYYKRGY